MDKKLMSDVNMAKYAQAPTWSEIESFLTELHMNMYHWERFYGVPFNVLTQVKSGVKRLPPYAWHYVFERIKPTYGAGFIDDYSTNKPKNRTKSNLTNNLTVDFQMPSDLHERLLEVK